MLLVHGTDDTRVPLRLMTEAETALRAVRRGDQIDGGWCTKSIPISVLQSLRIFLRFADPKTPPDMPTVCAKRGYPNDRAG